MSKLLLKDGRDQQQDKTISLTCQRCGHCWEYKGKNPYVAICPYCKTTVQIKKRLKKNGGAA